MEDYITIKWSVVRNFDGRQVEAGKRVIQIARGRTAKDYIKKTTVMLKTVYSGTIFEIYINCTPGKFWAS